MTIDLTSIANAVIALIATIITAFVIPWIRSKTTAAQFEKIKMWVTVAVEAAEQLYTGSGRGAEKKAYVVEFLNSKGFKIDAETLDKLIEAAPSWPGVKFCVSDIRQSQEWHWKAGRILA